MQHFGCVVPYVNSLQVVHLCDTISTLTILFGTYIWCQFIEHFQVSLHIFWDNGYLRRGDATSETFQYAGVWQNCVVNSVHS